MGLAGQTTSKQKAAGRNQKTQTLVPTAALNSEKRWGLTQQNYCYSQQLQIVFWVAPESGAVTNTARILLKAYGTVKLQNEFQLRRANLLSSTLRLTFGSISLFICAKTQRDRGHLRGPPIHRDGSIHIRCSSSAQEKVARVVWTLQDEWCS